MLLGLAEGGPWHAPCTVTGLPAVPTAVPPPLVGTCSPMDPLSLNLAFVFAAGRAAQCDVRQKSPCPQGLALLLRPPSPGRCSNTQRHLALENVVLAHLRLAACLQ